MLRRPYEGNARGFTVQWNVSSGMGPDTSSLGPGGGMSPLAHRVARAFVASAGGACLGLFVGLVAIAVAPDDGFGDLAAAAVTTVFLVPLGLIIGGVIGWWTGRHGTPEPVAVHDTEVREETT